MLVGVSAFYQSDSLLPGQPRYTNAVAALDSALAPLELLDALQAIENGQGRERLERWGPRTLDLDILLFGDRLIDEPRLKVPHYHMQERAFVLYPLAELAPADLRLADGRTSANCSLHARSSAWNACPKIDPNPLWERACSRKRSAANIMLNALRNREQLAPTLVLRRQNLAESHQSPR